MNTATETAIDPVCGMKVVPATAAGRDDYEGHTYYFCGRSCLERFKADPAKYLSQARPPSLAAEEPAAEKPEEPGVEYTCPMHPEIVRDRPGACPICGMALEPRTITLDEGPNPELIDMTRRFRIAAVLAAPVVILAMSDMVAGPGLGGRVNLRAVNWFGFVVATPVVLWAGWPFFERAPS